MVVLTTGGPVKFAAGGVPLLMIALITWSLVEALDNGAALTPPMGWLAWERFTCQVDCQKYPDDCISSKLFRQMGQILVDEGYSKAGYNYVNVDDCWSELERDPRTEQLLANGTRFPEGIENLSKFMHDRGLKLGIYGDCGYQTCGGYPAQLRPNKNSSPLNLQVHSEVGGSDFFDLDARTFASWAIDSFKFDGCHIEAVEAETICPGMSRALAATNRSILMVCEWPFYMMYAHAEPDFELASRYCNVWRYYDDIEDSWQSILNTIDYFVRHQSTIVKYHGPGHWFDPDQLVIGNFGLSWQQSWAQMALWSIWSAPLYMSNDLRKIDPRAKEILTSKHLIAINQDKLGVFGLMVKEIRQHNDDDYYQAFVKPILPFKHECPSFALVYLNRNTLGGQVKVSFKLADLLTGAPLYVARKHVLEWAEREPDNAEAQKLADNFMPSRCLEWLRRGSSSSAKKAKASNPPGGDQAQQQQQQSASNIPDKSSGDASSSSSDKDEKKQQQAKFKVFDLIEGKYLLDVIDVEEELALPVSPSGVRAIRLEAII